MVASGETDAREMGGATGGWTINGSSLVWNGHTMVFPLPIKQVLAVGTLLVVRGQHESRYVAGNVWGVSADGQKLWEISSAPPLDGEFVELELRGATLYAWNFNGYRCVVGPSTGCISDLTYTK